MSTLTIVRHGESEANKSGIISDKNVDHPLTNTGIQQAEKTASLLKDKTFDLIVCSTRTRARRTAEIINQFHNASIILSDDLIERDYGIFSGVEKELANNIMIKDGFEWLEIPQSEKAEDLDRRITNVLDRLNTDYPNMNILVSTHEDIVRTFQRVLNKISPNDSMKLEIKNAQPHFFPR